MNLLFVTGSTNNSTIAINKQYAFPISFGYAIHCFYYFHLIGQNF